jgi:tight adherence protein C
MTMNLTMFYTTLFVVVIFVIIFIISYLVFDMLIPTILDKRISNLFTSAITSATVTEITQPLTKPVKRWIEPLAGAAMNSEQWLTSPLRIKFSNAGLNRPTVVAYYFAAKSFLTFAFPLSVWFFSLLLNFNIPWQMLAFVLLFSAFIGYYLPNGILERLVRIRQHELFIAFPDALDLLRVCVEAGLGLDAAIERVGREIQIESEALAQEFSLLGLELRAGAARADALKNLALRIGLEDIDGLVSMLIQSDRFGTSIAESLRMHSDSLRTKRRLIAEEAAAKLPVKILMPLIFCVFPALLTVLMGPAFIAITHVLMPATGTR